MYSLLKQGAFGSTINLAARRFNNLEANKFSAFKVASAPRNFQTISQRQGQTGLAESPRYDVTQSQTPIPQARNTPTSHLSGFSPTRHLAADTPEMVVRETTIQGKVVPLYYQGSKFDKEPYWQKIGRWKEVTQEQFLSHRWNVSPTFPSR
jgi:hypothetical protein